MPWIDDTATLARAPEGVAPPVAPNPSLVSTIGAAFRQDNPLVNLYSRLNDEAFPPVEGYNPLDDIRGTDYEAQHSGNFVASRSPGETQIIKRRIDQEDEDRKTLAASGTAGFVAQVAAGLVDPTLALPGGVVVRSVKGGYEVGRSALAVAGAAAGQAAIQEGVLQAAQETRTAGESAMAIGSSAIIGGLIGAGAASLLTRTERAAVERLMDADRLAIDAHAATLPAGESANRFGDTNVGFGSASMRTYREQLAGRETVPSAEPVSVPQDFSLEKGEIRPDGKQRYHLAGPDGPTHAVVDVVPRDGGKTLEVAWVGYDNALGAQIPIDMGVTGGRKLLRQLQELYPEATTVTGNRVSGAKRGEVEMTLLPPAEAAGASSGGGFNAAGAAATDTRQLEMFRSLPGTSNLSVTRRTLEAEAVEARRVMADLAETPYRFKEGDAGVAATQGPALDRLARMEMNGTRVAIADNLDAMFSEYRFGQPDKTVPRLRARIEDFTGGGEGKMSFADFKKEVSLALQSGDQHAIPQVAQAAQFVRSRLLAPWSDRAENAIEGFNKITPANGEGYFPHVWNKQVIKAKRPEFTNRLVDLYQADQTTKRGIQDRLGKLSEDLKALRDRVEKAKTPEERAAAGLDHDAVREKIEAELAAWEGKSTSEAKSAIKAREKYATDTARDPDKPRLESADAAMDRAVKKILDSERDLSVQELRDRAHQTVDRIIGSPDGRLAYDIATGGPRIGHQREPMPRGALAGRSLNVTNAWARDWIENDIEHVVAQHLRTVVPDVLLAERFGDVEMTQSFRKIEESYAKLIDTTKSEKERVRLGKERDAVIRDVAAVRDRVRGVYGWSPELANMARIANGAKAVNNLTSMGSAALSSLPDLAGVVFRYGITGAIRDGWAPFFRGLTSSTEEWGKFKSQMRAIGIGVETAINARQHSLDDVVDVYRPQSRVERVLQGASDKFFIANLLAPLTDAQKLIASHAAVSEIIRAAKAAAEGKATKRQIGNLAESGIDAQMAGRIHRQFHELGRGTVTDGVHLPNTADWTDRAAADALNGAVAREVDIAVVTPGQEKPLWMSKPVISLLGQFKAFTAASTERILVANLQRRDAAALSGLVFSVGLGMLTYKLNSFFGGQKVSDRPQDWFKEGISRSGVTGWFEEGNALASKATRGSVDMYRTIGADKPLSRFASRSAADMLLGPTWGKIEALPKITGAIASGEWNAADTTAVRRLIPLQNLFYLRGLLNKVEESANAAGGVPPKPQR